MEEKKQIERWKSSPNRYHTEYKKGYGNLEEKDWTKYVCFSKPMCYNHEQFSIRIAKNKLLKSGHLVIITDKQVTKYLSLIKRYFGGINHWIISKDEIIINFDFNNFKLNDNKSNRLLVYTFMRYIFEKESNINLYLAFKVKEKHNEYRLLDLLLWSHSKSIIKGYTNSGHTLLTADAHNGTKLIPIFYKFDVNFIKNSSVKGVSYRFEKLKRITNEVKINEIKKIFDESTSNWGDKLR